MFNPFIWFLLTSFALCATEESLSVTDEFAYNNLVGTQYLLQDFEFSNSWNKPSEASYTPSVDPNNFNRVILELSANTTGANYDRLVMLFIDDIEVWRSSTPEPDSEGTCWSATKDLSHYAGLFKTSRTINLVVQNVIDGNLDGVFYVSLVAKFYNDASGSGRSDDSWAVDLNNLPQSVKALRNPGDDTVAVWYAPSDEAQVTIQPLDRSVNRALLHIFASESGDDEFWWQGQGTSVGPSRFINVYLNDTLAGVVTPFPNIFTGGMDPMLWKPIVGIRAFDLPAYFIDISPFLPLLWDGSTKITLEACNGIDATQVPWSWILSMNLLTWSTEGQVNSGTMNTPKIQNTTSNSGSVLVNYDISNSAKLTIGGKEHDVAWEQTVDYNNTYVNSNLYQLSEGSSKITGLYSFDWEFNFPIDCVLSDTYIRVQQTYDAVANSLTFYSWIDSSVNNDSNGTYISSNSAQYLSSPQGAHFASSKDLEEIMEW